MEAFGSPNYIDNQFQQEGAPIEGLYLTQGIYSPPAYDFENARYILSFGSDFLESYWSPVQVLSAYGQFRRGRPEQRGRLVQIEPRLSVTGIKADEWIPTRPGTEGLIALAIANMIIKEGLYNKDFVTNHAFGFENWTDARGKEHIGFKEIILSEYGPDLVSKQTGIPVDTFIRLAREFAANQPSLAIGYRDRPFHQMAVSVLNGLVGNVDSSGGVLIPRNVPLQALPPFGKDGTAHKGLQAERIDGVRKQALMLQQPYLFAENVISGKPYRPEVLFFITPIPSFRIRAPTFSQRCLGKFLSSSVSLLTWMTRLRSQTLFCRTGHLSNGGRMIPFFEQWFPGPRNPAACDRTTLPDQGNGRYPPPNEQIVGRRD